MASSSLNASQEAALIEAYLKAEFSKDLGLNLGPFILGFAFDSVLFGVMLHQLHHWYSFSRGDRAFVKCMLGWAFLVATATTFFGVAYIFHLFVYGFGVFINFVESNYEAWYALLDALTILPVQLVYLQRAYKLNKSALWVILLVFPFMLAAFVGGIVICVETQITPLIEIPTALPKFIYFWVGSIVASDLLITGLILFGLWRSRTGWKNTDRLLNKLVRISIESQAPATLVAIIFTIEYAVKSDSMLSFWELWHPKIYVVSLLAVLNQTIALRQEHSSGGAMVNDSSQYKNNTFGYQSSNLQQATIHFDGPDEILVNTDTYAESNPAASIKLGMNREFADVGPQLSVAYQDDSSHTGFERLPERTKLEV